MALAAHLGAIECDVGVAQEVLGLLAEAFGDTDARGDGHRRVARRESERRGHDVEYPLGHHLGSDREGLTVDQDDELVTSEPSDGVAVAQDAGQALGHENEELVARGVAERVIDVLEVVEVEEEGGHGRVVPPESEHHLLEAVEDQGPVREPGQRIVERLVFELRGPLAHQPHGMRPAGAEREDEQRDEQADGDPTDQQHHGVLVRQY